MTTSWSPSGFHDVLIYETSTTTFICFLMGLHVGIYRDTSFSDCTNNGVTSEFREFKGLCLTNVDGPFKPDKDYPGAKLEKVTTRWGSHVRIVPDELQGKHSMMGGNYAATSDSRFREAIEKLLGHNFYGALPVHDRTETREQMNSYD